MFLKTVATDETQLGERALRIQIRGEGTTNTNQGRGHYEYKSEYQRNYELAWQFISGSISRINPNVQTSVKTNEWLKSNVQISECRADSGTIAWCPNPLPASLLVPHSPQSWGLYIILLLSCPTTLILVSQISSIPIPHIPPKPGFPNSHPQMSRLTPPHVQIIYIVESRLPLDDSA